MSAPAQKAVRPKKPIVAGPDKVHGVRWWRELGWRHLVAWIAIVYAVIPVMYVFSASINPKGTLQSTTWYPTYFSLH